MKINDQVEVLVRTALDAAVQQDKAKFEDALKAFGGAVVRDCAVFAVAVCAFVLSDVYNGSLSAEEIAELSDDISHEEAWVGLTSGQVAALLTPIADRRPFGEVVSGQAGIIVPFVVAANLLASCARSETGELWFDYLDKVEAAIEAA